MTPQRARTNFSPVVSDRRKLGSWPLAAVGFRATDSEKRTWDDRVRGYGRVWPIADRRHSLELQTGLCLDGKLTFFGSEPRCKGMALPAVIGYDG
jgi:hypothetical protein